MGIFKRLFSKPIEQPGEQAAEQPDEEKQALLQRIKQLEAELTDLQSELALKSQFDQVDLFRAEILRCPLLDKKDPEHKRYKRLVSGKEQLSETHAKQLLRWISKTRRLIDVIAADYFDSHIQSTAFSVFDYVLREADDEEIIYDVHEYNEADDSLTTRQITLPTHLLWSDWKRFCQDERVRKAIHEEALRIAAQEGRLTRQSSLSKEDYERAKALVEQYEKEYGDAEA